jgi:hypothetical protein
MRGLLGTQLKTVLLMLMRVDTNSLTYVKHMKILAHLLKMVQLTVMVQENTGQMKFSLEMAVVAISIKTYL